VVDRIVRFRSRRSAEPRRDQRLIRCIGVIGWAYTVFLGILAGSLYTLGDRWWPASLVLFGPRWIWGVPLVVLVPAICWWRPRSIGVMILAAWLFIGPLSGACIPVSPNWGRGRGPSVKIRVLTCNVHSANLDTHGLGAVIAGTGPDIVSLQEWSDHYPIPEVFLEPGWHVEIQRESCLGSRYPIREAQSLSYRELTLGRDGMASRHVIETPVGKIQFFNLHPISPRDGLDSIWYRLEGVDLALQKNIEVRRLQSELASRWAGSFPGPKLLVGDFNLPVESAI
jgi:hypothetical protein